MNWCLIKTLWFSLLLTSFIAFSKNAIAQTEAEVNPLKTVEVKFVNKGLLPKKVVIITYQPSSPGNGTNSAVVAPGFYKKLDLEVGTKVFLGNKEQVEYVMSGQQLTNRTDKPFCIVSKEAKQSYTLPSK